MDGFYINRGKSDFLKSLRTNPACLKGKSKITFFFFLSLLWYSSSPKPEFKSVLFKLLWLLVNLYGSHNSFSVRNPTQIGLSKERNLLACVIEKFRDLGTQKKCEEFLLFSWFFFPLNWCNSQLAFLTWWL